MDLMMHRADLTDEARRLLLDVLDATITDGAPDVWTACMRAINGVTEVVASLDWSSDERAGFVLAAADLFAFVIADAHR